MSRYNKESPFQQLGIVWNVNAGIILTHQKARKINQKPVFSFDFDSLYCEPTLCHKVIDGFDHALLEGEILEVMAFLEEEAEKPDLINGVDASGKYFEGVTEDKIVRAVSNPPPNVGVWRLDMETKPHENWYQCIPIDADGFELPSDTTEENAAGVVTEHTPSPKFGEVWKWDGTKWIDGRHPVTIANAYREIQVFRAKEYYRKMVEDSFILYNDNMYGTDSLTVAEISQVLLSGLITPLADKKWTPKGKTVSVTLTYEDFKAIYKEIIQKTSELANVYLSHKKALNELTDPDEIKNYNWHTGYDPTAIHYVDVGDMTPEQAVKVVEKVMKGRKKKQKV
jgi:hypothetical protein